VLVRSLAYYCCYLGVQGTLAVELPFVMDAIQMFGKLACGNQGDPSLKI
jgi:hypothetical protein